jgi:hypothetical protein
MTVKDPEIVNVEPPLFSGQAQAPTDRDHDHGHTDSDDRDLYENEVPSSTPIYGYRYNTCAIVCAVFIIVCDVCTTVKMYYWFVYFVYCFCGV